MKQKVLITGASRGLGYFLTKRYLEEGDTVFAGAREVSAPKLCELKKEYPETLCIVELEVTDTNSTITAAKMVGQYTDKLDIIINNAAIHGQSSFEILEKTDLDECLTVYDVNSIGPVRIVKAFLSFIRNNEHSKIINISSESASIGTCKRDKEFDYCMSKAALNMGTKLLSNYLKKDQAIVLAVHPGWMRTDMGGSNAHLDPYETACKLVDLFEQINDIDHPVFIDNKGEVYPW